MWRTVDLADCGSEWLQAKGVADIRGGNPGAILYFHGGAFITCGLNTHRRLVSRISYSAKQPVLNVGYRQMPYEPITESVADGVDGFRWLLEQGYAAEDITIAGDSAGGYLAFSVARAVIDKGWGQPAGVVAISPLLDFDPAGKQGHRNADRCETFPMNAVAKLSRRVAAHGHPPRHLGPPRRPGQHAARRHATRADPHRLQRGAHGRCRADGQPPRLRRRPVRSPGVGPPGPRVPGRCRLGARGPLGDRARSVRSCAASPSGRPPARRRSQHPSRQRTPEPGRRPYAERCEPHRTRRRARQEVRDSSGSRTPDGPARSGTSGSATPCASWPAARSSHCPTSSDTRP